MAREVEAALRVWRHAVRGQPWTRTGACLAERSRWQRRHCDPAGGARPGAAEAAKLVIGVIQLGVRDCMISEPSTTSP